MRHAILQLMKMLHATMQHRALHTTVPPMKKLHAILQLTKMPQATMQVMKMLQAILQHRMLHTTVQPRMLHTTASAADEDAACHPAADEEAAHRSAA